MIMSGREVRSIQTEFRIFLKKLVLKYFAGDKLGTAFHWEFHRIPVEDQSLPTLGLGDYRSLAGSRSLVDLRPIWTGRGV